MEHRTHVATVLGIALATWLKDGDAVDLGARLREILDGLEDGER